MSDRRYGVYERFDTGDEWPLSSIPDALVEEAAKAIVAYAGLGSNWEGTARAALGVLFPGEEEE